jgi:hydroxyacylglutathione hydrolase
LATNPFLRVDAPAVREAIARRLGRTPTDRVEAFAELRRWKDGFRA